MFVCIRSVARASILALVVSVAQLPAVALAQVLLEPNQPVHVTSELDEPEESAPLDATADELAPRDGPCDACDVNCDALYDLTDVEFFIGAIIDGEAGCSPCAADLDQSGSVDGLDLQPFVDCLLNSPTGACCIDGGACVVATEAECAGLWFGANSMCEPGLCATAELTAYRPQHGASYFPLVKTAVPDALEATPDGGPGIRINEPGDIDPAGEDDLIEVLLDVSVPGAALALRRTDAALRVWTTRSKQPGTEIPFSGDRTGALPLGAGQTLLTFYVEWAAAVHGEAELHVEPLAAPISLDVLRFHTFRGIVLALGGEDQSPTVPLDANHGTFVVAHALYQQGYDVHIYDEDNVGADGGGAVLTEAVEAVSRRLVDEIAIFGYSHGGGSTHDLAERLDNDRAGIGIFEIVVTSYVDAVENDSDFDISQELRRPPSSGYHANHWQTGSLTDFFLDGGPVPNSDPPPSGLNVETTPWGSGSTHFQVDDFVQVRSFIQANLESRVMP